MMILGVVLICSSAVNGDAEERGVNANCNHAPSKCLPLAVPVSDEHDVSIGLLESSKVPMASAVSSSHPPLNLSSTLPTMSIPESRLSAGSNNSALFCNSGDADAKEHKKVIMKYPNYAVSNRFETMRSCCECTSK